MRGMTPGPAPIDDRGASLALMAIALVAFVAMASLVIDVGVGRLTQRSLIPATDAGALAGAQAIVADPGDEAGACSMAEAYVLDNEPAATMTHCEIDTFGTGGRITVVASTEVDTAFAAAVGEGDFPVGSMSTATWGAPTTVTDLRPLALCHDGSAQLRTLIDNPPSGPTWIRVPYVKDDPSDCGGSPYAGNFATVDFEGGASVADIRDWVTDGYPGQIGFDDGPATNCAAPAVCHERPWALLDLLWQLGELVTSERYVAWPIFDYADDRQIHLVGVLRARLYDFWLSGSTSGWYLEFKIEPGLVTGTCCDTPGVAAGNDVIAICGVDHGALPSCDPGFGP